MIATELAGIVPPASSALVERESRLQRLVAIYIVTGVLFMLLPGTFLGVWNLLSISADHTVETISPAWIQAHGHAQIFGWLGTFILGIGFYSLSKMGHLPAFAVSRGWICYLLWTSGVAMRWCTGVTDFGWPQLWRYTLPLSAFLEAAAFVTFFLTVSGHRANASPAEKAKREPWMLVVMASTVGFLATVMVNFAVTLSMTIHGVGPAVPFLLDQRMLILPTWGFLVPTVWGFNARWLPIFLGLRPLRAVWLYGGLLAAWVAVGTMLSGFSMWAVLLLPVAAIASIMALGIFERAVQPAKLNGVHGSFPYFVRGAYVWLFVAACLSIFAAAADRQGGIWGASRHALTVGFLATMVFSIGPKILPAFCGARVLFSPRLMFVALLLLNVGCTLRVASEILAYERYAPWAWSVLPVSAIVELVAVTCFAANMALTLMRPPAHLVRQRVAA